MPRIFQHVVVNTNQPKINSVRAVRSVLEKYVTTVTFEVVPEVKGLGWKLKLQQETYPRNSWPLAVQANAVPAKDTFDDEKLWLDAENKLLREGGDKGFTDLLIELAKYLDSHLILQAIYFTTRANFRRAQEWIVQPGATEVETKNIVSLDQRLWSSALR